MDDVERLKSRLFTVLALPLVAGACNGGAPAGSGGPCSFTQTWCMAADAATACPATVRGDQEAERRAWADGGRYEGPPTHVTATLAKSAKAGSCCYEWEASCPGGRPLLDEVGRARVARVTESDDWLARIGALPTPSDPRLRRTLARAWLRDARLEHASVASFARATLELLALGAPPELVRGHQLAALDEIRHAEIAFALASRHAARALGPGPLRAPGPRPADCEWLAHDTLLEGGLGETVAALTVARAASAARAAELRCLLESIAEDEAVHAALAWSTLSWALGRDPDRARAGMRRAVARALAATAGRPARHRAPDLAPFGQLAPADVAQTRDDAWRGIVLPLLAELGLGGVA